MQKEDITFWDVILWLGIIAIFLWALLKSFGVINSPIWVDMIPYFGLAGSAVGGAYKLGKIMECIENTNQKVDRLLEIEKRFENIETSHNLCINGELKGSPYKK